jgi:hypothetical protein
MKNTSLQKSTLTILVATITLAAVTYAQHRVVSANAEIAIRFFANKLGILAVPVIVAFAYRAWIKVNRPQLPTWRNGLGLSSLVIVSGAWLIFTTVSILGFFQPGPTRFFNLEWVTILLYSSFVAALLGTALTGISRTQSIAAALSMWAWVQSTIRF